MIQQFKQKQCARSAIYFKASFLKITLVGTARMISQKSIVIQGWDFYSKLRIHVVLAWTTFIAF